MSDSEAAAAAPAATGKAKPQKAVKKSPKKKSKNKAPVNHPHFRDMIKDALGSLKERSGSSRQAILKYICAHYNVGSDMRTVNNHLKLALRAGVKNGTLKQSKGQGASGSFKIGEAKSSSKKAKPKSEPKAKASKPKKSAAAKGDKAKKTKKPKSASKSKPAKKVKTPKKAAIKKPKKTGKSPKKSKKETSKAD